MIDTSEEQDAIQRDLDRLEHWAHGNLMRINKTEYKVLHLDVGTIPCQHRLRHEQIESSPDEKDSRMLVDERLNMTQQHAQRAQKTNMFWFASKTSWSAG
ncbi:hypothetical protein TURU_104946 [Turdus rufiventris]|nr:hypothetical protein TURU_104946 [Turdus rufiventris]